MKLIFAILLGLLMSVKPVFATENQLSGSQWKLSGATTSFLRFEDQEKVRGFGGCNSFFGRYSISGRIIKIGPLASTRKMCSSAKMETERKLLTGLEKSNRYRRKGARLTLLDSEGHAVLKLRQTDRD